MWHFGLYRERKWIGNIPILVTNSGDIIEEKSALPHSWIVLHLYLMAGEYGKEEVGRINRFNR